MSTLSERFKRVGAAISDRVWARTRPRLDRVVYANGGLGDELMLTAIAAAARHAGRPLHVLTDFPDLWHNNTDPASVQTGIERWFYAQRRRWISTEIVHLPYVNSTHRHIAEQMAARIDVTLPAGWRPVLHVPRAAHRDSRLIVLQNSCRGARYASPTKEWPQDRWQQLIARLDRDFRLVQLGTPQDPPLAVAEDRRGRTTLREAAELLAQASLFLGLESGLQHVASAVETPAVIIYGGRSRPHETGYASNRNLTRSPECAGCGLNTGCPNGMICMDISVDEVEQAVRESLRRPRT